MSKRQSKFKIRLNLPDLQIQIQQENQILFLNVIHQELTLRI